MFILPPPLDVQPVDFEIQAPDASAAALHALVTELFGVRLDEQERILTIKPVFPDSWNGKDAALTTADFDFSCKWSDNTCIWEFEGFGAFAESYDSIVVHAPVGTLMAGELADDEGVKICYYGSSNPTSSEKNEVEVRILTKKERKELAKKEKERKKREKKEADERRKNQRK